ncbi:MAG: D-glycero-beta-D-manno-heptose-7-phosphate kinase [Acidobacteriia bacterium]|nr:D-glycero-beta-D-manno-heptose-7-phosphate kinase [Terriglobia bacterium]
MQKLSALKRIVGRFRGKRIAIYGDLMLDEFLRGRVSRIAPEAPVPIVEVTAHSYHLGGAGNVAANIDSLGGIPLPFGVVGDDEAGQRIRREFRKLGIDTRGVLKDARRPTTLKTRIIAEHQQVVRADRERRDGVDSKISSRLLSGASTLLSGIQALIISDYDKGLITRELLETLLPLAAQRGIPVCLDPKISHASFYTGATLITPNHHEAEKLSGISIQDDRSAERAARKLLDYFSSQALLITRGEHGMTLCTRHDPPTHIPTLAREVFDVTGAGDTVISTLALGLAAGATMKQAAYLANAAAGIVVGKLGTATVSRQELLQQITDRNI